MIPNFAKATMGKRDLGFKNNTIKFLFFGSSRFSEIVLEELEKAGYSPILKVTDAKSPLPQLPEADFSIVASFGKILPEEIINRPKYGSLNVHPSLLPELRGPAPIQGIILGQSKPGVTIIKMDEQMDHGPILAQEPVEISPLPDHYAIVEEKLGRAGGRLLVKTLPNLPDPVPQDHSRATYIKLIKKEDGLLDLNGPAEINLRKVLAYSTWPGAYFFFKTKMNKEVRVVVKDGKIENGKPARPDDSGRSGRFIPTRVIPAGKKEMDWQDFLRGNA